MIARIVPQFFCTDLNQTLAYYEDSLGFSTQFRYGEPAYYAGAIRDEQSIFFRQVEKAMDLPSDKYAEEFLDAYILVKDVDRLFEEYASRALYFHRRLDSMPWGFREFVIKDCDERLLCFGEFSGD